MPELSLTAWRNRRYYQERGKWAGFKALLGISRPIDSYRQATKLPVRSQPWKPATLQAPLLLATAAFSIAPLAILLYLSWRSRRDGGLAFAPLDDKFSTLTVFAYSYLPILLAVIFGTFWSWVDLDTKRLEPYFQLSKPEGASSADSILLQYPFDFIALAPIKALKRRHWSVFLSGTTTMMIFWAITPLLGAVFTENRLARSVDSTASTVADLALSATNKTGMHSKIILDAYGVTWLGQDFPDFVKADGAVAPFQIKPNYGRDSNTTWSTTTNLYSTKLSCTPAKIGGNPETGHTYDNGRGCHTDPMPPWGVDGYHALYVGYFNDPHVDWALSYLGCPPSTSHTFLAIWAAVSNSTFTNVTALFCEPNYWSQRVKATVTASNNSLVETVPLGPPVALSQDLFNTSDFEYLLGAGTTAQISRAEVTETEVIDQWHRIKHMNVAWPVGNMVGFALGATRRTPDSYFNASILSASFEAAHQLLFGLAVRRLVSSEMVAPDSRQGSITSDVKAVVVVPELAIVVEVVFGLVSLFILSLLLVSSTRKSQLRADPASLSDVIAFAKPFAPGSSHSSKATGLLQGSQRYKLIDGRLCARTTKSVSSSTHFSAITNLQRPTLSDRGPLSRQQSYQPVRPFEMRLIPGVIFLTILCAAIVVLVILYVTIAKGNGLPLPSTNQTINQLVLKYIPITFATFLEPFWILLNRLLCLLQPFEEIRQGRAKPSQSLDVKYTSLPPQLIFWRAVRGRHFLLLAVCLIGLSANFLAVSLGALFEDNFVQTQHPAQFVAHMAPVLNLTALDTLMNENPNPYKEHYYLARSNVTNLTELPAWITPRWFFIPFDVNTVNHQWETSLYKASTQGIGLDVQCRQLNSSGSDTTVSYNGLDESDSLLRTFTSIDRSRNKVNCKSNHGLSASTASGFLNGTHAAEFVTAMEPMSRNPGEEEQDMCSRLLIVAFMRANVTIARPMIESRDGQATDYHDSKALFLGCKPTVQIATFDVTVDQEGHVQEYSQKSPYGDVASVLSRQSNMSSLYNGINRMILSGEVGSRHSFWHTELTAESWMSHLVKSRVGSTAFLDSSLPPPSASTISPAFEDIYGRLFTILLGINTNLFLPAPEGPTVFGATVVSTERVFISRPMFVVSIVLLGLNVVVAVIYYAKRPPKMLREMPTTIASVLGMVEGSGLLVETTETKSREEWQIGYGRYVGTDGKPHIGIDRRPFVMPWSVKQNEQGRLERRV
ncbi:MAG: hypothetical protein Q9166_005898 [cf. Caloplaca sp. 2 TL-2023]